MADDTVTEPTQPEAEGTEAPTTPTEEATPVAPETTVPTITEDVETPLPEVVEAAEAVVASEPVVTPEETPEVEAAEPVASAAPEAVEPVAGGDVVADAAPVDAEETVVEAAPVSELEAEPTAEPEAPPRPGVGERPAITAPRDIGDVADDLSAEDFAAVIERTVFEFKEGDIVGGTVVRVDPDEVLVDIGYKAEGVIPVHELSIRNHINPAEVVKEGEPIEALVLQMEDDQGRLVLSKKRAQYERAWGRIEGVMNQGGTVSGPVIEVVKGGLIVDIGLRGFLPASLVDLRRVRDLAPFIGESIEAKVIELDKNRNNVVLSRRAHLEEAQAEQRQAFLSDLEPGDVRDGVVSSVVNFGAFVDLGGMDGLVHVSELSWQHVSHPSEIVTVGDKVQVRVLEVDRGRERISLSIRQTREDPWEEFIRDTELGSILDGEVTKTVPFGAFIAVGEGVEGLVHVSEIALHHVESPELELSIGQQVRVKVTEVDADRRRVSLSIKQALPEWEERSTFSQRRQPSRPRRREFQREDEATEVPTFAADASLEAILEELKERGIGRK
jgi:small subunit ribosomal protein S1